MPRPASAPFAPSFTGRLRRDPALARAVLVEAVQALLDNELSVARALLRDAIKASIGYGALSKRVGVTAPSLARMFGANGNPTASNLFAVIAALQRDGSARLEVRLGRQASRRAA